VAHVLAADGVELHLDVDGQGEPVTVFAHGITNSCMELAAFTPFAPGTKVRFCFRGHGHSATAPADRYRFSDYALDLEAVADEVGATRAVGTSLGAGAITRLLCERPDRFERLVFLLPAGLDRPIAGHPLWNRTAELLETMAKDDAIAQILRESGRDQNYIDNPGLQDFDMLLWQDLDPVGVARAIRGIVGEVAVPDIALLEKVQAPALVIAREGDAIHPMSVAEGIADAMPNGELIRLASEEDLFASIPILIERVAAFLA
jgi:3-oxoadipate enol-lactonase